MHHGVSNRYATDRVWLISERPCDEAAEVLRAGGAEVTEVHTDGQCANTPELDPPSVLVITSTKTGRALVKTVERLSDEDFEGVMILVCDQAGPLDVRLLLQAGVRGIVLREQMEETLLPAVAAAASGQVCVPTRDVIGAERPVLSIREKQVVGLVAMG